MKIEIPDEALSEAVQVALLAPPRHSHDEPPIRAIARAVEAAVAEFRAWRAKEAG